VRRFVLGTAGHVDHGKTTLVMALTGVDTDRLPEEKRRGITIELGFAPLVLDDTHAASVIDMPGHKRLVHTMIAGASGIEVVLLVVAADEGVMPQTREHLAACEVLGIRRAVVAITKVDRVERDLAELAGQEVGELCAGRFEHEVVLVSAKTGEGLDALKAALRRALDRTPAPEPSSRAWLSVDRVFSVKGAGTVVTGTLVRGAVATGDSLWFVDERGARPTTARGLHVHDKAVERAEAPTRLAVNLGGLGLDEVSRGGVVTSDASVAPTTCFDARLELLRPVRSGAVVEVYVGTARSPGRLRLMKRDASGADDERTPAVLGRIKLDHPLVLAGGDRFVVRTGAAKGPTEAVLGGGKVLDARPPTTRRAALRIASLDALDAGAAVDAARALVGEHAPRPLAKAELGARFAVDGASLARALEKMADRGEVVRTKGDGFADRASLVALGERARSLVAAHHAAHPLDRGIKLETLRQKLAVRAGSGADEVIRLAGRRVDGVEPIVVEGDIARLASFIEGGSAKNRGPVEKVALALREAGLKGLGEFAVTELLGAPAKEVKAVLAKVVRDGAALSAGAQWFDRKSVDELRDKVRAHLASSPVLTIAEFKELSGLGRKQAIPLLELFDREGVTIRRGDDRLRGPKAAAP
jgi:selenocysteine-specific elongation factor